MLLHDVSGYPTKLGKSKNIVIMISKENEFIVYFSSF